MKLIRAKYKLMGVGCIVELYKAVYSEGYAITWDEDAQLLFADENNIALEDLREIVTFAAKKELFDEHMLIEKKVLTSHGIQKQWLAVVRACHRKNSEIDADICLLGPAELSPDKVERKPDGGSENSRGNEAAEPESPEENPQSKAKQSKVNKLASSGAEVVDNSPKNPQEEARLYAFCLKRSKRADNPEAYARSLMAKLDVLASWRESEKPPDTSPSSEPPICNRCGRPALLIPGKPPEAMCEHDRRLWTFENGVWAEAEALVLADTG
jgi:hypothetical protein